MQHRRWRHWVAPAAAALVLGLPACSTEPDPTELPGIKPPAPRGKAVSVDVCGLLPPAAVSQIVNRQLRVVGRRVEPSRLETLRCDFGRRFAEPAISVELTTDPVALAVFSSAYGEAAGGDPRTPRRPRSPSVLRTEGTQQSIHSFVRGAVISVRTDLSLMRPIQPRTLIEVSRLAIRRLPDHPVLRERGHLRHCPRVSTSAVEAAIARPLTVTQEFTLGSAVECSWGAQPGSVLVSATTDRGTFRRWQDTVMTDPQYDEVNGVFDQRGVTAHSSDEDAGDLVVLAAPRVYRIRLVPAAGFSSSDIPTTPAEKALATEVVAELR